MKSIRERSKNLPKAIIFPQYPSNMVMKDDDDDEENTQIGDIAKQYLGQFATISSVDKNFRLWDENDKFFVGNKVARIKENNLIVDGRLKAPRPIEAF